MSQAQNTNKTNAVLSPEATAAVMAEAEKTLKKVVPAQTNEEQAPKVSEMDLEYGKKLNEISTKMTDAALAGDKIRMEELIKESMDLMDEHRSTKTENETSKIEGLKNKALGFLKTNKKAILIGTGVVTALGVIVKVTLGQSEDETESMEDAVRENDETETSDEV